MVLDLRLTKRLGCRETTFLVLNPQPPEGGYEHKDNKNKTYQKLYQIDDHCQPNFFKFINRNKEVAENDMVVA
jgi:hypothetical protein